MNDDTIADVDVRQIIITWREADDPVLTLDGTGEYEAIGLLAAALRELRRVYRVRLEDDDD